MPQIRHDFDMYYTGSYVGIRSSDNPEVVHPFYITSIDYDRNIHDGDISDPECLNGLIFRGEEVTGADGSASSRTIVGYDHPDLVLELPSLGYVKLGRDEYRWVTYRPNRTVKKGITSRRLEGISMLNHRSAFALYDAPNNGRISCDYIRKTINEVEYLMYKGLVVGEFTTTTTIEIEPEIENQIGRIREENPECQVSVKNHSEV